MNIVPGKIKGLGPATIERLEKAGITTMELLALTTIEDLKSILKITKKDARAIIQQAKDIALGTALEPKSMRDILVRRQKVIQHYSTGSVELDKIMGGGVETWAITILKGPFSSGKSQLAYCSAVSCIKAGRKVGWIETEAQTFVPERILEIAKARGVNIDIDNDFIVYTSETIRDVETQLLAYEALGKKLEEGIDIGLIVIDSFSPLFRATYQERETFGARSKMTAKHLAYLNLLAAKYNLAVLLTTQVMGVPDTSKQGMIQMREGADVAMYGGELLKHGGTHILSMTRVSRAKKIWKATMVDSPCYPDAEAQFIIGPGGIHDVKRSRGPA